MDVCCFPTINVWDKKKREEIRFFLLSLLYKSLKLKLNAVQCAITKFHVKISASQSTIHIVRVSPSHADYVYGTHWIVCYMLQNILYKMLWLACFVRTRCKMMKPEPKTSICQCDNARKIVTVFSLCTLNSLFIGYFVRSFFGGKFVVDVIEFQKNNRIQWQTMERHWKKIDLATL